MGKARADTHMAIADSSSPSDTVSLLFVRKPETAAPGFDEVWVYATPELAERYRKEEVGKGNDAWVLPRKTVLRG